MSHTFLHHCLTSPLPLVLLSLISLPIPTLLRYCLDSGHLPWLAQAAEVVWYRSIYLPNNLTWYSPTSSSSYPQPWHDPYYPRPLDAMYSFPIALLLLAIRCLYIKWIGYPWARCLGLNEKKGSQPQHQSLSPPHPILEKMYMVNHNPPIKQIRLASKQLGCTTSLTASWFRWRRRQDKPSIAQKFCEGTFKFFYYVLVFIYGIRTLLGKDWYWDNTEHYTELNLWRELHVMEWDIFIYYQIAMGFYLSQTMSQFIDVRRSDFTQMFLHHCITLALLITSFSVGWHRVGSIIVLIHDFSDWTIEITKNAHYARYDRLTAVAFAFMWIGWFLSRLVYYPVKVMTIPVLHLPPLVGWYFPYHYISALCLIALLIMHFFWFHGMCVTLTLIARGTPKDSRSDTEEESEERINDDDEGEEEEDKEIAIGSGGDVGKPGGVMRRVTFANGDVSSSCETPVMNGGTRNGMIDKVNQQSDHHHID